MTAPRVLIWGRRPPPIGGVAVSFARYADMASIPPGVRTVDLKDGWPSLIRLASSLMRQTTHIISASRAVRLPQMAQLAGVPGQRVVPYLRGGGLVDELPSVARRRDVFVKMPHVWVTNQMLGEAALDAGAKTFLVVSPFLAADIVANTPPIREYNSPERLTLVTACYEGRSTYGITECVEAVARLREATGTDHRLFVVHYGARTQERQLLEKELEQHPWLCQRHDLSVPEMEDILSGSDALLRLTSTDGDSNLVRQALAAGLRVVATDCVPRPVGVEVCGTSPNSAAAALEKGGRLITEAEPSTPFDVAVSDLLRADTKGLRQ